MRLSTLLRLWYYARMYDTHRWAYLKLSVAQEWVRERIDHNGAQIVEYKRRMREERG